MEGSVVNVNSGEGRRGQQLQRCHRCRFYKKFRILHMMMGCQRNVAMKENINPTMITIKGKQWKRLARGGALTINAEIVEPKGGKRKGREEGSDTLIDVGASALKKAKSVEAERLLTSGMRRSIGDDKSTRVWEDPWVVFDRPTTLTATNQYAEEVEKSHKGGDKWVWEVDRSGSYTVKSGYRHAMIDTWKQFETGWI
ncbi:uncharacterized protein G2W53_007245 [Senna tora]|uniref:Uncharacterized protein n=1 Tax=Senna tora TaxID=362788 RepID=A0A834X511_9FABA|nr:uncharacterized protein G2W53_007245 [Senna tora]